MSRTQTLTHHIWAPWLVCLGVLTVWCWWQIETMGDVRARLGTFFGWFAFAFLIYAAALWLVHRAPATRSRPLLLFVLFIAMTARLVMITSEPTLSNDIHRYRWDGRVQLAGYDPYAYPPNAPELRSLWDDGASRIDFPHLRTVYPPAAQLAVRIGAWFNSSLISQKAVFVAAELVTLGSLLFILALRGLNPLWVVAYAWHPLTILEISGSGHNDALGIAFLWLGLAAWQGRRWFGASLAWGVAFLSKFTPILLIPWWGWRRKGRRWMGVFLAVAALPMVMNPNAVSAVFHSFTAMSGRVEFNASVCLLLMRMLGSPAAGRFMAVALWGGVLIWWARREADPVRYLFGALIAMAVLSPVLHPWYVLWLTPFCCLWRIPAVLTLSGTVVLAYMVWPGFLANGTWEIPVWVRLAEYVPVLVLGMWELRRVTPLRGLLKRGLAILQVD